ncbi:hypothetical protein PHYSODRAFT_469993, partial [Phytophthora sojae]
APPRRKECEVRSGAAPAGSATSLSILFTYACTLGTATSATRSGNWDRSAAHGASCVASATARACKGHVKKSLLSGIKVRPCYSDVLTRSSRR